MAHLSLDRKKVDHCRELAKGIAKPIEQLIATHTTVAIERATLRLLGVEGAIRQQGGQSFPEANVIVEDLRREGALDRGVLHWFVNGMIQKKMPAAELAAL
ncbi:MAG: lysine 5,6-aminomutase subunit alpha TIM-barrel domain-containing protein, partial [Bdellovibrionota bacterium]